MQTSYCKHYFNVTVYEFLVATIAADSIEAKRS